MIAGLLASHLRDPETLSLSLAPLAVLYVSESTYDNVFPVASVNSVLRLKHPLVIIIATTILYEELQEETERTTHESNQVLHEKMDIEVK